ncbi:MAG: hypothetical protein PHH06_05440 [Candidatus Gracilibacteria bacterium]|nr:hypothetical protein [Candidatus Gracilibacteria bacterium]
MDRDAIELSDAYEILGIDPVSQEVVETSDSINIFLGRIHQESLTLAKAIILALESTSYNVNIVLVDIRNLGRYAFDGQKFHICRYPDRFHYVQFRKIGNAVTSGDSFGFQEYVEDKFLTGIILRMNGIKVPGELVFKGRHNKAGIHKESLKQADRLFGSNQFIVLKPSVGECGNGVQMLSRDDIKTDFYDKHIRGKDTILLQEKIDSYPIVIDGIRKDWNLRVLVTFDFETKKYIVVGMIGRIGDDGKPINISKSAEYISFEEISKLAGWTEKQCKQIEQDIIDITIKSVTVIVDRVSDNETNFDLLANHQTLAGVDIIVNKSLEPIVIEVNSANSGGLYKLMKYKGIEAITPIAHSIILKSFIAQQYIEKEDKKV